MDPCLKSCWQLVLGQHKGLNHDKQSHGVEETEFPAQVRSEGNLRTMAIQWARTGWSESTEDSKSPFLLGRGVGG